MSFPVKRPQKCPRNLPIRVNGVHKNFKAEHHPAPSQWGQTRAFDPINASLGVYVDMIMMFQRLLIILGNNRRK